MSGNVALVARERVSGALLEHHTQYWIALRRGRRGGVVPTASPQAGARKIRRCQHAPQDFSRGCQDVSTHPAGGAAYLSRPHISSTARPHHRPTRHRLGACVNPVGRGQNASSASLGRIWSACAHLGLHMTERLYSPKITKQNSGLVSALQRYWSI